MTQQQTRVAEQTRAVIGGIQDAFVSGDYQRFARYYDDEVDWTFHAPVSVFPFAGRRQGKTAMLTSLAALSTGYKTERIAPQFVIAEGDRVAVLSEITLVQRATERVIRCRVASLYRLREGRVIEYEGFLDSFDAVEQALGRWLQV